MSSSTARSTRDGLIDTGIDKFLMIDPAEQKRQLGILVKPYPYSKEEVFAELGPIRTVAVEFDFRSRRKQT